MTGQTGIEIMENVSKALMSFPSEFRKGAAPVMMQHGQAYIGDLVTKRLSGRPGLNRRTGNLSRSFNARTQANTDGIVIDVSPQGPGSEYANLHEVGGTVKPVKSKYLWIPIAGNLTPSGVARITPTEAINRGGFFAKGIFFGRAITKRNIPQRSQHLGSTGYKGKSIAKGADITPLFVLKKSVTVPARLGAGRLWESSMSVLAGRLDTMAGQLLAGKT